MPNWLSVVILLVVVVGFALAREAWRKKALDAWCRERGFRVPEKVVPGEHPPLDRLVKRFDIRGGRLWGTGTSGVADGVEVTFAEHETSPPGKKTGVWCTVVAWKTGDPGGPLVVWPNSGGQVAEAIGVLLRGTTEGRPVPLGGPDADTAARVRSAGDVTIDGAADVRRRWLTEDRLAALEAWTHGGAFAVDGGYAAWRVEGVLTPARLDELTSLLPQVRRLTDVA